MSWLLGAGMGFLRGGPMGALIGGAAQHFLSKKIQKKINQSLPGVDDKGLFVTCLVVVLTKIAMTEGSPTPNQIRLIHKFFVKNLNYAAGDLKFINEIVSETQRVNPELEPFVEKYKKACQDHYLLLLLALAYQIALIAGSVKEETEANIRELAVLLKVSYEDHDRIRRKYSLEALKTPYMVLGISSSADNVELKKAYRNMLGKYHPDRVVHLGEDHAEEAHLKFLEIQAAYEELTKIRGL